MVIYGPTALSASFWVTSRFISCETQDGSATHMNQYIIYTQIWPITRKQCLSIAAQACDKVDVRLDCFLE